jgi:integrase
MSGNRIDWTLADAKLLAPSDPHNILARVKQYAEFCPMAARDYDWYFTALHTGLRLSEVGHIEKADILPNRLIVARRKKRHLQPAPIEVMPAVMEVLRRRAAMVESGYIFPGRSKPCEIHRSRTDKDTKVRTQWTEQVCVGGHASLRSIQRRWRLLVEELGIYMYGRGIHTLRHTAITNIYTMTHDLRKAQVFAGHESSKTTEIYAHVVDMQETLAEMPVITGD